MTGWTFTADVSVLNLRPVVRQTNRLSHNTTNLIEPEEVFPDWNFLVD